MFCGEMALLERGARSATVTAITPMSLLAMSATDFNILVTTAPTFTRRLLETLSTRLRTATDHATAG
jgi:CRP-like cAMP-binding protein